MILNKKILVIILAIIFEITIKTSAQSLPDSTIKKIDSLFVKWNTANSPRLHSGYRKK